PSVPSVAERAAVIDGGEALYLPESKPMKISIDQKPAFRDAFSMKLRNPMHRRKRKRSRQANYQLRNAAAGRCLSCGGQTQVVLVKATGQLKRRSRCPKCLAARRDYQKHLMRQR